MRPECSTKQLELKLKILNDPEEVGLVVLGRQTNGRSSRSGSTKQLELLHRGRWMKELDLKLLILKDTKAWLELKEARVSRTNGQAALAAFGRQTDGRSSRNGSMKQLEALH